MTTYQFNKLIEYSLEYDKARQNESHLEEVVFRRRIEFLIKNLTQ